MNMASSPKLKTAFKKARAIRPLHSSGPIAITPDATKIITCVSEEVLLTEISSGTEICRFADDAQPITALCISPSSHYLLIFRSPFSLFIYEIPISAHALEKPVQAIRSIPRAHQAPVHVCKVDPTSTYLASGSADGIVKVWDILRGYVTHVFKGHGGPVSALAFNYPRDPSSVNQERNMQLITASVDTRIRIFDLYATASRTANALKPVTILEGHDSVPRGLDVTPNGKWLISGGRDSVVLIWDLSSRGEHKRQKGKRDDENSRPILAKTVPILERVEAVGFVSSYNDLAESTSCSESLCFYTGGEHGVVKLWDGRAGTVLYTLCDEHNTNHGDQEEQRQIVDVIYIPSTSTIVSVHADQNILFYSLASKSLIRQLIGFNDEIVDATYLSPSFEQPKWDSQLALATNSSLIRVYSTSTLDARLLSGHHDIVLCLDHGGGKMVFASGSKDRSARIWAALQAVGSETKRVWGWGCVAICEGHAESVGAIAMSRKSGCEAAEAQPLFMFTGSQDRTIKMWDLSSVPLTFELGDEETEVARCKSLVTLKAHEKDINSLDVAPNDKLLVSGSQDRTAKVYEIECVVGSGGKIVRGGFKLIGTCTGHKRGVWSVKFGRTERVLATGSGDKTVKLWSLEDFTCVKTFEGHTNSVLRVNFMNSGMQLVSAASDGLVKLWNVREEECVVTLDNHEDKVWALAISTDERTIVSGAADSVVTFWEDCTEELEKEKEVKRADMVQREQDFMNYLSLHDYEKAIQLAIAMEQPGRLLSLFKNIRSSPITVMGDSKPSITGHPSVDDVIRTLARSELASLLRYVRNWNANAKTSNIAQDILYAVMKLRSADDVMEAFGNEVTSPAPAESLSKAGGGAELKELVDAMIPYTERHLSRTERLVQDSYVVDYILAEMDDGMFDWEEGAGGIMDVDMGVGVVS